MLPDSPLVMPCIFAALIASSRLVRMKCYLRLGRLLGCSFHHANKCLALYPAHVAGIGADVPSIWGPNSGSVIRRHATKCREWGSVYVLSMPKILSACHWSCPSAWLALVLLLAGLVGSLRLGSLLLLVLPQHLCVLVRARSSWHPVHHALLLMGASSRGVHSSLGDIVPCHLVLHQALLHDVERLPVGLLLAHVWILRPDLIFDFHNLRLDLRRQLLLLPVEIWRRW